MSPARWAIIEAESMEYEVACGVDQAAGVRTVQIHLFNITDRGHLMDYKHVIVVVIEEHWLNDESQPTRDRNGKGGGVGERAAGEQAEE